MNAAGWGLGLAYEKVWKYQENDMLYFILIVGKGWRIGEGRAFEKRLTVVSSTFVVLWVNCLESWLNLPHKSSKKAKQKC